MSKERMCLNKRAYESAQSAWFFANADGLRAYRCPHCERWHLTSRGVLGRVKKKARK